MGMAKRELERQDAMHSCAQRIAFRAGVLKECDIHCDLYIDTGEAREEAYRLANYLFTEQDPLAEPFEDRREMTDTIQQVCDESPDDCYICAKNMMD